MHRFTIYFVGLFVFLIWLSADICLAEHPPMRILHFAHDAPIGMLYTRPGNDDTPDDYDSWRLLGKAVGDVNTQRANRSDSMWAVKPPGICLSLINWGRTTSGS